MSLVNRCLYFALKKTDYQFIKNEKDTVQKVGKILFWCHLKKR